MLQPIETFSDFKENSVKVRAAALQMKTCFASSLALRQLF
jgi:hypothetical protein